MAERESLADRLQAFVDDADKAPAGAFERDIIYRTLGGCVKRNIGEIVAALREREARMQG